MFLDCPAYLDQDGAVRCGLPAEVRCRFTMRSTDGPVESAMIRCPAGHYFCGAIESLTWDGKDEHDPGSAAVTSRAGRDSVQGSHDGLTARTDSPFPHFPAEAERRHRRPNTAPAYYLGHPAALWMTVMRPRRRPAATRYPVETAVSCGNPTRDSGVLSTADSPVIAQVTAAARQGQDSPIQPAAQAAPTRCHARSRLAAQHPEHDRRAGCPLDARANGWPSGPDDAPDRNAGLARRLRAGGRQHRRVLHPGNTRPPAVAVHQKRRAPHPEPVLAVLGTASPPMFAERQKLLLHWLSNAEPLDLPGLTHLLHAQDAAAVAGGLTRFFARHRYPSHSDPPPAWRQDERSAPRRPSRARARDQDRTNGSVRSQSQGKDDGMPHRSEVLGKHNSSRPHAWKCLREAHWLGGHRLNGAARR